MLIKLAKGVATGNLKNLLWLPNLQQFISRLYGLCFLDFGLFGVALYRLLSQSFSQAEYLIRAASFIDLLCLS